MWSSGDLKVDEEGNIQNKKDQFKPSEKEDLEMFMKELKKADMASPIDGKGPLYDDYKAEKQAMDIIDKEEKPRTEKTVELDDDSD